HLEARLAEDGAGVHLPREANDAVSDDGLTVDERMVDGRRPAILREERGVEVDRAQSRVARDGITDFLAEGDDDEDVRRRETFGVQVVGSQDVQAALLREGGDGGWRELLPPTGRAIRLGVDAYDVVALDECLQGRSS